MALRGKIRTMPLPEVLQWISLGKKSGTLLLLRLGKQVRLVVQKGRICGIREIGMPFALHRYFRRQELRSPFTAEPDEDLGSVAEALALNGWSREEFLGDSQNARVLQSFLLQRVMDICAWEQGEFEFLQEIDAEDGILRNGLDTDLLMMEWADRALEVQEIRAVIPDQPTDLKVVARASIDARLSPEDASLCAELRSSARISELLERESELEFPLLKRLASLVERRVLRLQSVDDDTEEPESREVAASEAKTESRKAARDGAGLPSWLEKQESRLRSELMAVLHETDERFQLPSHAVPEMIYELSSPQFQSFYLSSEEGFLLSRVDGRSSVRELSILQNMPQSQLVGILLDLTCRGIVLIKAERLVIGADALREGERKLQEQLNPLSDQGHEPPARLEVLQDTPLPVAAPPPEEVEEPEEELEASFMFAIDAEIQKEDSSSAFDRTVIQQTVPAPVEPEAPPEPIRIDLDLPAAARALGPSARTLEEAAREEYQAGIDSLQRRDFPTAVSRLVQATELDPEQPAFWAALARAYLLEGHHLGEARKCCERALEFQGWDARLHMLLGRIHERIGNLSKAGECFLRAMELDHTNPKILEALSRLQLQ